MIWMGSVGFHAWLWLKAEFFSPNWKRIRGELRCRLDAAQLVAEIRKPRNDVVTLDKSQYTEKDLDGQTLDVLPNRDWCYVMDDAHREAIKRERETPRRVRYVEPAT